MNESILTTVKRFIGLKEDDNSFDSDIIVHINSFLMILSRIGVGPDSGFSISDETASWSDFLGEKIDKLEAVKTYVSLRVKLVFDPPSNSAAIESLKSVIDELAWYLNISVDPPEDETN